MNHRRALRIATDTGLFIFLVMIAGVVLWTTDEVLDWNILPDWIDKYAQLLVIILSILAGFAVVISIMCSFAVLAEAAAEKAGMAGAPPSPRARRWVVLGTLFAFGVMVALQRLDLYRAEKRHAADLRRAEARYDATRKELEGRTAAIIGLFPAGITRLLAGEPSEEGDQAIAKLLTALQSSTPFDPEVAVLVAAPPPYSHCIITALPEPRQGQPDGTRACLRRRFLTDFPDTWERKAVEAMFAGEAPPMPRHRSGVFINASQPSAMGRLELDGRVAGILMVRGSL